MPRSSESGSIVAAAWASSSRYAPVYEAAVRYGHRREWHRSGSYVGQVVCGGHTAIRSRMKPMARDRLGKDQTPGLVQRPGPT